MPLTPDQIEAFLSRTDYFRRSAPAVLAQFSGLFQEIELRPAEFVFREGDESTAWYLIYSGEVAVSKQGQISSHTLANLERGEGFGEMGLIDHSARMGSVYAVQTTRLLALSRDTFQELLGQNDAGANHLLLAMAQTLCQRQREITYILQELVDDPGPRQRPSPPRVNPSLLAGLLHG